MNLPKHLINLIGVVLVAAIVVGGIALVALPMWGVSQTTETSARSVAQTNDVYAIELATLEAADARRDEITRALAELRTEIAGTAQLDDVFDIVIAAAADTGAVIESVTAGEMGVWTPRTPGASTGEAASEDSTGEAAPEGSSPEQAETPTDADAPPAEDADAPPADTLPPQQQVPVTIEVTVADAAVAAAFIDALGRGPRLLAPVDATLDDGTLTVTALAFIRTED